MEKEVISAIIGAGVAFIGTLVNTFVNKRQNYNILKTSREMSQQTKDEIAINRLNERKKYLLKKLNEFYFPLKNYLEKSKHYYEFFIEGKPADFRTLIYLLDRDQEYEGVGKIELSPNDKVYLDEVFKVGFEMEKLIADKKGIIDDKEFIGKYEPGPGFTDVKFDKETSLLGLFQSHLSVIRIAYSGTLIGEKDKFSSFVYPRELNKKVDEKIAELLEEKEKCDEAIKKLIS